MSMRFAAPFIVAVAFLAAPQTAHAQFFATGQQVNLSDVGDDVSGTLVTCRNNSDHNGYSIAAGDFNGDGDRDVIIGAEFAPNNARLGEVYLLYGPLDASTHIALRTDSQTVRFVGETGRFRGTQPSGSVSVAPGDRAGSAVEMFDLNGDGYDDIIIGAIAYDSVTDDDCDVTQCNLQTTCLCNPVNQSGRVYIIFGRPDEKGQKPFTAEGQQHLLQGVGSTIPDSMVLKTTGEHHRLGKHLARGGDIDGDGNDDLVIGAQSYSPDSVPVAAGAIYVVYGWCESCDPADSRPTNPNPQGSDTANTFRLEADILNGTLRGNMFEGSSTGGWMGAFAGVGDMDGDGYGELVMGEYQRDPDGRGRAGTAWLIFGEADLPTHVDLLDLINDNNPDGVRWSAFQGIASTVDDRPSPNPQTVFDHDPGDYAGWHVAAAGDVNGDGKRDLLIAAPCAGPDVLQPYGCNNCGLPNEEIITWTTSSNQGEVYLLYGSDGTNFPSIEGVHDLWEVGSNIAGATFRGARNVDRAGDCVASAGDFNHDGFDDILIGAVTADPPFPSVASVDLGNGFLHITDHGVVIRPTQFDTNAGKAYLIPGGPWFGLHNIEDVAVIFNGVGSQIGDSADNAGDFVAPLGDLNGDGYDDIAVGAPLADTDGNNGGDAYIIFGRNVIFR